LPFILANRYTKDRLYHAAMKIPSRIPYFKTAHGATAILAFIWMALEGDLRWDLFLALALVLLTLGHLAMRYLGGRTMTAGRFVALAAAAGIAGGFGAVLLTLFLMILKTGIHAHGPEYTSQDITWVWSQMPIWGVAGGLVGLGLALLVIAAGRK
jgi:hypothetical protein